MIDKLYIIGVIVVTVVILYLYLTTEYDHKREIDKIEALERKQIQKDKELDRVRALTRECQIVGLDTPRKCYYDSNYVCSWNEQAQRCDQKQ